MIHFETFRQSSIDRVETFLRRVLEDNNNGTELHKAITYSVFSRGKRIRPVIVYLIGKTLQTPLEHCDPAAAALELIHTYSLIHDDLPAMDDDDLRRGLPTCHKAFSESTAILAGDGLLTLAFEILSDPNYLAHEPEKKLKMIHVLAQNAGINGMVEGQALDMSQSYGSTYSELCKIHQKKTGALIQAAVKLSILCSDKELSPETQKQFEKLAENIGLMFQIQDDILDHTGNTAVVGKRTQKDSTQNKSTFPLLLGLDEAQKLAQDLQQHCFEIIENLNFNEPLLKDFSQFVLQREY